MTHPRPRRLRRGVLRAVPAIAIGMLLASLVPVTATSAPANEACDNRTNNMYQKLLECITLDGVMTHMEQFQKIADSNDDPYYPGTRAAGTKGYHDSAEYVAGLLEDAGYVVTLDEFEFAFVFPAVLEQLTPIAAEYETARSPAPALVRSPAT